jgi:hypothetical protein
MILTTAVLLYEKIFAKFTSRRRRPLGRLLAQNQVIVCAMCFRQTKKGHKALMEGLAEQSLDEVKKCFCKFKSSLVRIPFILKFLII